MSIHRIRTVLSQPFPQALMFVSLVLLLCLLALSYSGALDDYRNVPRAFAQMPGKPPRHPQQIRLEDARQIFRNRAYVGATVDQIKAGFGPPHKDWKTIMKYETDAGRNILGEKTYLDFYIKDGKVAGLDISD